MKMSNLKRSAFFAILCCFLFLALGMTACDDDKDNNKDDEIDYSIKGLKQNSQITKADKKKIEDVCENYDEDYYDSEDDCVEELTNGLAPYKAIGCLDEVLAKEACKTEECDNTTGPAIDACIANNIEPFKAALSDTEFYKSYIAAKAKYDECEVNPYNESEAVSYFYAVMYMTLYSPCETQSINANKCAARQSCDIIKGEVDYCVDENLAEETCFNEYFPDDDE